MKYTLGICRVLLLLTVGLVLVACGGDAEDSEAHDTDTLAISTQPPNQVESSPPAEPTNGSDETVTAEAPSSVPEQSSDSSENADTDVSDNPWGKDIPEGPAPTVPPNPPSDFDSDGDGFYTLEELEEAIRFRYAEYEWPPNYVLDQDTAIEAMYQTGLPQDAKHEAPGEYTFLGLYHQCAWELTLIDASLQGDQELIDKSIYQLVDFGQNKNPLSRDENGKAFMRDIYDRAVLGDVAPLQEWVGNNCDTRAPYLTPESGTPPSPRGSDPDTDSPITVATA